MMRSNLKLQKNEHDNKTNIQSEKEGLQYCSINNAVQSQLHKQILFMEEKYQKIKKNLHQKKLMGDLNRHDVEEIGNIMNIIAMKYSQEKKNSVAQEWLRRAFKYCDLSERVRIVTYNNLACIYKQSNDLPMAFYYINKAQKQADYFCIEMQDEKLLKVVTDCSLNLCAILSAMGQHYKALRAARKALGILKSTQNLPGNYYKNLFPLLKYNEAVELQRLKMYEQAQFAYMQAQKSIGITEQLAQRVSKAIQEVRILKEGNKNKNRISISRASKMSKRTKLSLPKFSSSPALQLSEATTLLKNYESVKTQKLIKNDKKQKNVLYEQLENKKQFRSIEPKANKDRKLFYQNYKMSNDINTKTMIRFRKSVLQSVQNFG